MSRQKQARRPDRAMRDRGFTLIEVIVVAAIIAIAAGIALPNMREMLLRGAASDLSNQVVGDMNLARQEAVKRGVRVAVISASGSGDWSTGWRVAADRDRNGSFSDIVRETGAAATGYRVSAAATGASDNSRFVYDVSGSLETASAFDVNVCRPTGGATKGRWVHVYPSGMIKSRRDTSGSPAPSC